MRTKDSVASGWIPASRTVQPAARLMRRPAARLGEGPARRIRLVVARHRRPLMFLLALAGLWGTIRVAAPPAEATVPVPVASHDLPAGRALTAADIRIAQWPADVAPAARAVPGDVRGSTLATPISAGEAITAPRMLGPGLLAGQPSGSVAITVRLADPASLAPVRPGDRVDVLAAVSSPSWDDLSAPPAAVPGSGTQTATRDAEPGAVRLAAQALVLAKPAGASPDSTSGGDWAAGALGSATGQDALPGQGDSSSPGVLVLAVDRATAARLAGAANSRPFSVVLLPGG